MIQEARYTSPSGREAVFAWEAAKRKTELKTGVYTFPGMDGAHVQHQGAGAKSFPLVCIFNGVDGMEKADAFEAMLIERGIAELQHPLYGTLKVVPTGNIERDDDPVNRNGESVVSVTFTETITDEETATLSETAADAIEDEYENFSEAAAIDFASDIDTENIGDRLEIRSALEAQTQGIIESLESVAAADKKTFADWQATAKELKDSTKKLYSKGLSVAGKVESVYVKGLNIARLTLRLMKLPSDLAVSLAEKIKGYSTLTAILINQYKNDPFGSEKITAAYATARLALTGAVASIASGSALTIAEITASTGATKSTGTVSRSAGVASRESALAVADNVADFLKTVTGFMDAKIGQNVFVDADSASYYSLCGIVDFSIQLILNSSFSLPMKKTIALDRNRQVVELCAQLYGTTDNLDEFITQNNFSIDEMELLPMGRKVSYYVKSA